MAARTDLAISGGLHLRKRTATHLHAMAESREYLVTRYGPEMTTTVSQINRLTATLDEVASKVMVAIPKPDQCICAEMHGIEGFYRACPPRQG
jgi:hypothetical protein